MGNNFVQEPTKDKLRTRCNEGLSGKIKSSGTAHGVMKKPKTSWTEEEIAVLKALYPRGEKERLIVKLENRTWEGIKQRARKLRLKFPKTKCKLPKEEIEKLYRQVGVRRAVERLRVDRSTFYNWLKRNEISLQKKASDPDLRPSVDLLYVLGVLRGDGFTRVGKGKCHYYLVGLGTISEEFARSFANVLRNIGLRPQFYSHNPPSGHSKKWISYSVKAASKKFVGWYRNLSNNDIKRMIGKNDELTIAFIRGFYESEGAFYLRDGRYPIVKIGNTDPQLLRMVGDLISSLSISINFGLSGKTKKGKDYWYLHKCGKDALNLINLIKPCIRTKPSNLNFPRQGQQGVLFDAVNHR